MPDPLSQPEHEATPTPPATPAARIRRRTAAEDPRRVLLLVLVLSVVAHAVVLAVVHDQPVGEVSLDALERAPRTVRLHRAAADRNPNFSPGDSSEDAAETTTADLTDALLAEDDPPDLMAESPDLDMREVGEPTPDAALESLDVALAGFSLPTDMLRDAGADPGPADTGEPGTTTGSANGNGTGERTAAADAADEALGNPGFADTSDSGDGDTAGFVPPHIDDVPDDASGSDSLDIPLDSDRIDFTRFTLDATTQLNIPEHLDRDFNYFVSRFDPNDGRYGSDGYFRVDIVAQQSLTKLDAMPKDVVFLVDTSSSISERWVEQVVHGVTQSLWRLNAGDRFNIVLFDEKPAFFNADDIVEATPGKIQNAIEWIDRARPEGYTDVNAALSRLLRRDQDADRVYNLVLISDGLPTRGVRDTRELINLITRDNAAASIYGIGVGNEQNKALLDFLAYRNRGFTVFVEDRDDASTTIQNLMSRLRYPLIKNVQLNVAGSAVSQVHPETLPNIHHGERFSIYGRYDQLDEFTVRVTGDNGADEVDFTFTRDLRFAPDATPQLAIDWGFWKLHHLYSEMIRAGDTPRLRQQIRELREVYDLRTLYE